MVSLDPGHPWLRTYPDDVDWHAEIPERSLVALFDDAVARYPDRPCLDFLGKRQTYRQVGEMVDRAAKGLQDLGLGAGDRVGLFLPNIPYFVVSYYAILRIGGVVVNFNPLSADAEVAGQIEDSGVETIVTLDLKALYDKVARMFDRAGLRRIVVCGMAGALPPVKRVLFSLLKSSEVASIPADSRHVRFADLLAKGDTPSPITVKPGDLAVLQYTGGTTGLPKGAMLSHGNLFANTVQSALWFVGARPGQEVMLGVLPLFHVFSMTVVMNLGLYSGAEIVLLPRFQLDQLLKTIDRRKPTLFAAVPTIYSAINAAGGSGRYNLTSIQICISGGAPLPTEIKTMFERLTGCRLVEGYGLTEASPVTMCNPFNAVNKTGSVGLPLPGTVVEIVSLEDGETAMPMGERGEVCLRGPQVMSGYWQREEETRETLRGGRLHTGDVGYMDEDGYIFIVDRIKDVILCGGYNVYPRNVEEAMYQHPAVEECIVLGVPDPYRGQTVKAYVHLVDGQTLDLEQLTAFLEDKLSPIEMPKLLEFRDELPKTLIGKLSRKALADEEAAKEGQT